jgi:hypothetical protein
MAKEILRKSRVVGKGEKTGASRPLSPSGTSNLAAADPLLEL